MKVLIEYTVEVDLDEWRAEYGPWLIARDLRDRRGVWVVALEGDPAVTVWAYPEQLSTVAP